MSDMSIAEAVHWLSSDDGRDDLEDVLTELERLRAMWERADEVANGEGWSWDEQVTARHILGEKP